MKTILATTDFSPASRNAVNYAAELALGFKAQLVLFHAYAVPIVNEATIPLVSLESIEKKSLARLHRMEVGLRKLHGRRLQTECVCRCGFAVDEINEYTQRHDVSLVVMGMQGAGYFAEKLGGSITTALIASSPCPVLSIDRQVSYTKPKKIVFASDLKEIKNKAFVAVIKQWAQQFKAEIQILNVFKPDSVVPSVSEALEGMKLEHFFEDVKHSFQYAEDEDVVNGINNYVSGQKSAIVAMVARKHNFIEKLFSEPHTKKMAFHSKAPLLTFTT